VTEFQDWTRGVLFLGKHNSTYIPVLVDENGNLRILMQGEWEGELRTVALDEDGRLSAFVIDSVDAWGQMLSVGNAELAVRLGSPVTYNQTGRTVFIETWKYGTKRAYLSTSGTGGKIELSVEQWLSDGYSLKMVAGSDNLYFARCVFYYGMLPNTTIGWSVAYLPTTEYSWFESHIALYDGEYAHAGGLRVNHTNGHLEIFKNGTVATVDDDIYTGPLESALFRQMKFTMNLETGYFGKVWFDNKEYDVSSYQYYKSPNTAPPRCIIKAMLTGRSGHNDICYLDNCIFTVAEPD